MCCHCFCSFGFSIWGWDINSIPNHHPSIHPSEPEYKLVFFCCCFCFCVITSLLAPVPVVLCCDFYSSALTLHNYNFLFQIVDRRLFLFNYYSMSWVQLTVAISLLRIHCLVMCHCLEPSHVATLRKLNKQSLTQLETPFFDRVPIIFTTHIMITSSRNAPL